jgi:zinc finger protein 830
MDQRKAIFRAKLRETKEKQQRRIDPALVRSSFDSVSICAFDLVFDYFSESCC